MMNKLKSVAVIALAIFALPLFGGVYVKFDPQGGTFAVPGVTMDSGSIPDEVMTEKGYAAPVRIGCNFAGWSSIANPKDEAELDKGFVGYYATPVTKATTFYAIWEAVAPYCYDSYGSWWREGDVLCGRLTNDTYSSSTRCSYELPGRGWICFKWRMVDAANPEVVLPAYGYESSWQEYVRFDDGHYEYKTVPGYRFNCEIYGQGDWQDARVAIANGDPSEFIWELNNYYAVDAIVQIADVTWEIADEFQVQVILDPCGGEVVGGQYNLGRNAQETKMWYSDDELLGMVDSNGDLRNLQYRWKEEFAQQFPHLKWMSKNNSGGSTVPCLENVSQDGVLTSREHELLRRLANIYCRYAVCCSVFYVQTNVVSRVGKYGDLPFPTREGCEFLGWSANPPYQCGVLNESDRITPETWLPLASNVTVYAVWDVPREVVVDPGHTVGDIAFGDYDWTVYNLWDSVADFDDQGRWVNTRYVWKGERIQCYDSNTQDPVMTVSVDGCGVLHVGSCEGGILLDGVEVAASQGIEVNAAGSHTIDFLAQPNCCSIGVHFSIESIRWERIDELNVRFDARGGTIVGETVRTYVAGEPYGEFPAVTRPGFEFLGWFTSPEGGEEYGMLSPMTYPPKYGFLPVMPTELVRVSAPTLYARWRSDLRTAIGGGQLRFATKGEWEGSSDFCHGDGSASAATADINWGKTNVMTTVVQGEGLLTFWWLQGDDFSSFVSAMPLQNPCPAELSLWLDGRCVALCADYASWKHMTLPVLGRGNHVVEWKYTPGGSSAAMPLMMFDGYDQWKSKLAQWRLSGRWLKWSPFEYVTRAPHVPGAWVDEVAWTPAGEVRDIVAWAKGIAEGHGWLTNVLPLIEAEYSAQIAANPANYEPVVLRAFTKLAKLGENENLKALIAKFGFALDYQVLGNFFGELDYYDAPLSNEVIDQVAAEAGPAIESALADFELIPGDWTGSIPVSPDVYPVSETVYVDLADVTLCKAALKGALSALAIAESYDLSVDYMNIEMEAILQHAGLPMTFEYFVEDHPDFCKRVRDAERLAEGKEILRDALETLQAFDELMVARSTTEMHFFEYNAKDAEKQQYAREEVAKMLTALDGEVEINNDDFRYASNFRIENLKQPATLVPFFAGELTRRYLPTEINGNIPVFDSFPSMAFGGMFPGLTKDIVAGWLAAYGYEVEFTPNSDYEPEVRFRTFSAAIPDLGVSATEEEIKDALAGTADEKVRKNITDSTSYAAFETWATKVQSSGVSLKEVKASPCSWQSFALAAPELIQEEITADDLKVEEFKPSSESGKFDFTVSVEDVTVGAEAVEENLKQVIGLEGAESLGEAFKSENVAIKFGRPEDGKLKFSAEPKNTEAKSFFMKIKVK